MGVQVNTIVNAFSRSGGVNDALNQTEEEPNDMAIGNGNEELSTCPKNLYSLHHEYEFGIGISKAVKYSTAFEQGKVKHIYSKCKIIWNVIAMLTNGGWTPKRAIEKIYEVYGTFSVTKIFVSIKQDKEIGGHPSLRIANL